MPEGLASSRKSLARFLREDEQYVGNKPEKSFQEWYVFSRFGTTEGLKCIDGAKDGGIDFIFNKDGNVWVGQSKFDYSAKVSSLSREELNSFVKLAKLFRENNKADFEEWIKTVREDLRPEYKRIFNLAAVQPEKVQFVFVSTKKCTYPSRYLEIEDAPRIAHLWELYQLGFTPPIQKINIQFEKIWHFIAEGFTTYIGLADVQDFLRAMDRDSDDLLFAQNVRGDLGSNINKEIKKTFETDPLRFWLGNNGVYIICRDVKTEGDNLELSYPSIINGGQTLHSIHHSDKRHEAYVLVRILKLNPGTDDKLLSAVVRRTNSQNAMKYTNLLAHDPHQLNIARYLDSSKIFYERKEKSWTKKRSSLPGYISIGIKEVAQWLSVLHSDIGLGKARSRVSELFNDKNYKTIFSGYEKDFSSINYKKLDLVVWSGLVIKGVIRSVAKKKKALYSIPQLLLIKAVYDAANGEINATNSLKKKSYTSPKFLKDLEKTLRPIITKFKIKQKVQQKKDEGIDYSNFFKRDDFSKAAYLECNKKIKSIRKILQKHMA
jgi:hypothetical protein